MSCTCYDADTYGPTRIKCVGVPGEPGLLDLAPVRVHFVSAAAATAVRSVTEGNGVAAMVGATACPST